MTGHFSDPVRIWNGAEVHFNEIEGRAKLAVVLPNMVFWPLSIRRSCQKLLGSPSNGTKKFRCDTVKAVTSPTQSRKKAVS
jgi:hypothetical protein